MKIITRTIWMLSLISLFTDMASEMLYPVMPVFLTSLGYSVFFIGVLEGLAEAVAGLSKGYFGKRSDDTMRRVPFVRLGYMLSALSKPVIGLFPTIGVVFSARTLDRLGKGIRTGARDALLAAESLPEHRGRVFGFHRAMDTLGAVLGPSLALLYLYYYPGQYAALFVWAGVPGLVAVAISFLLKEGKQQFKSTSSGNPFAFTGYWKKSSPAYRKLVGMLLLFALVNSSDVFLLLMMKEKGASDTMVIGTYIFYNLIYVLAAFPSGALADKFGLKNMLAIGLLVFSIVYGCMAFADGKYTFIVLFALYGIYAAFTEGISKALVTTLCKKEETATAIGMFTAFQSVAALFASSLAGLIWYEFGATVVFIYAAVISLLVAARLFYLKVVIV